MPGGHEDLADELRGRLDVGRASSGGGDAQHDIECLHSDIQCAICLENIKICDVASVKGCEHAYCVTCILQWATSRGDAAVCPTCKEPLTALYVHRDVDGTLSDTPLCEPVGFLARAPWYVAWAQERSKVTELTRHHAVFRSMEVAESARSPLALAQEEWAEEAMYGYFEDQCADDEELEDEYLASMARPRHTFGNRPWGPGGYVASGHRRARPAYRGQAASKGKNGAGKGGAASSAHAGASGSSKDDSKVGRRAKRKAARQARDATSGDA